MLWYRRILIALGGSVVLVFTGGGSSLTAGSSSPASVDDGTTPISGAALTRAAEAALDATSGGRVTGSEAGDEDSFYEVELTLEDGSTVDVQLDTAFHVVSTTRDAADAADGEAGN